MIKYRLHNIMDFGVELNDFYTENSLNNYIALFVDPPYWIENLETHENVFIGFDGHTKVVTPDKLDDLNVSRETLHETEIDWIKRHVPEEEKEPTSKSEKIFYILGFVSVFIMATLFLYLFLSTVTFIVEYFSSFKWHMFNIL